MNLTQLLTIMVASGLAFCFIMALAWLIERKTGNAGWVDVCWALAVGLIGVAGSLATIPQAHGSRPWLTGALAAFWSIRLAAHIGLRTWSGTDDPRYARLRKDWGSQAAFRMFQFLQIQALVSIPLVVSIILAAWNPAPGFRAQDGLAVAILLVAICGEGLADYQLRLFRQSPENKGKLCETGLWRWSRHPNYFFQALGWTAYPLFAIDFTGNYPVGFLAVSAPLCMYYLLTRVSGIPPLEEIMAEKYGEEFSRYRRQTNAFFPGPRQYIK